MPYSLFLTIRNLKDAKIGPTARPLNHTLAVVRGNMEVEQLCASNKGNVLKIQKMESEMSRLKSDLEEKVNNNENLNKALVVSKNLVESVNTKYAEAIEQVNKSAKTFLDHDKTSKALKKAKEEIA